MTATPETVFPELAYCRIKGGVSAIETEIPIYPGDASNLLPAWTSGQVFYLTITDAENHIETVKVTDIKLKSLTVVRGQDSTVARLWYDGAMMNPRINAALLDAILQQETERQTAVNPNGVLTPLYRGEKVFQTGPSDCEKRWFKSVDGTKWRLSAGGLCGIADGMSVDEYFDVDGYVFTPEPAPVWTSHFDNTEWEPSYSPAGSWDGAKWVASGSADYRVALAPLGTWSGSYRPTKVRITLSVASVSGFWFYTYDGAYHLKKEEMPYNSVQEVVLTATWLGDIGEIGVNSASPFNVTNIEFYEG